MSSETQTTIQGGTLPVRLKSALLITKISKKLAKLVSSAGPLLNAISLGLLPKNRIFQLVKHSYETNPDFYNPDKYSYEWEEDIIEPLKEASNAKNLLVAFCGKGREARIFSKHGYTVTGIDREAFMISDAKRFAAESRFEATFKCEDFDDYKTDTPYDIVYTSTWMYTTYLDKEDRLNFLKKCNELRACNGVIVISYSRRKDNFLDATIPVIAKIVAVLTLGNFGLIKGDRIERNLFWHYFSDVEIEKELMEAGMKTIYHKPSENGHLDWRFIQPSASSHSLT